MRVEVRVMHVDERFVTRSLSTGWKDIVIYFTLADDPGQHVCEARVSVCEGSTYSGATQVEKISW